MSFLGRIALGSLRAYSRVAPTQRGGYRLARLARRFVPRRQWSGQFASPGDVRLDLDLATYPDCCMAVGLYELDTLRLIRRLLRPGQHLVDCGANIGYFTLAAARRVGPTGRVDAFEPDPVNRARLEKHLADNGSPSRVRVHAVALSDAPGEATLYHPTDDGRNHGEASLFAPAGVATAAYTVRTARMDEALERSPDLVKMDIEGAELAALRGMTRLLESDRPPMLIIEHNPESAAAAGHRSGDLLRQLRACRADYQGYWIGWRLKELRGPEDIDAIARQGNILYRVS
ncbi:MAG TPA: FkbM family methyltransferase [Tepidisphaeraceae bacterium]